MIYYTKKHIDNYNNSFYSVVYTNKLLDNNRIYLTYCLNLLSIPLNNPFCSFELNRLNSIDVDTLAEPIQIYNANKLLK